MLPTDASLPVFERASDRSSSVSPQMIDVVVGRVASNTAVSKPESNLINETHVIEYKVIEGVLNNGLSPCW